MKQILLLSLIFRSRHRYKENLSNLSGLSTQVATPHYYDNNFYASWPVLIVLGPPSTKSFTFFLKDIPQIVSAKWILLISTFCIGEN